MFSSGIIEWFYQLFVTIVSYVMSWFGFDLTSRSVQINEDTEIVQVKPPTSMIVSDTLQSVSDTLQSVPETVENV